MQEHKWDRALHELEKIKIYPIAKQMQDWIERIHDGTTGHKKLERRFDQFNESLRKQSFHHEESELIDDSLLHKSHDALRAWAEEVNALLAKHRLTSLQIPQAELESLRHFGKCHPQHGDMRYDGELVQSQPGTNFDASKYRFTFHADKRMLERGVGVWW